MADSLAMSIFKELQAINRKSLFDDTAVIQPVDEDNPLKLRVTLTPQAGYYKGGSFEFLLEIPTKYPSSPPTVTCKTRVYHPNICHSKGTVCLSMLSESNSSYRIEHYINGLLFLFHHPNLDSRLNSRVTHDPIKFPLLVRDSLRGMSVQGMTFSPVLSGGLTFDDKATMLLAGVIQADLHGTEFPLSFLSNFVAAMPELRPRLQGLFPDHERAQSEGFEVSFWTIPSLSSSLSVKGRSDFLGVSKSQIIKEMLVVVDGKPHLLLTNGPDRIDSEALTRALGKPSQVPKAKEAKLLLTSGPLSSLSAFDSGDSLPILYNGSILDEAFVFTAAKAPRVLAKIRPADLVKLLPAGSQMVTDITLPPSSDPTAQIPSPGPSSSAPASEDAGPSSSALSQEAPKDLQEVRAPQGGSEVQVVGTPLQALDISMS